MNLPANISEIPEAHKEIFQAAAHDMVKDTPDTELRTWIVKLHETVGVILQHNKKAAQGQSIESFKKELADLHHELLDLIKSEFKTLTPAEIMLAAKKGARGVLSTSDVHFSVRTLAGWLKAYQEVKKGVVLDSSRTPKLPEAKKTISDTEKLEHIERFFNSWKKADGILIGYSATYDYIKDLGLLNGVKMPYKEIRDQAIVDYRASFSNNPTITSRNIAKTGLAELDRYLKQGAEMPNGLRAEAQKLTVEHWFKDLEEFEMSPKTFRK